MLINKNINAGRARGISPRSASVLLWTSSIVGSFIIISLTWILVAGGINADFFLWSTVNLHTHRVILWSTSITTFVACAFFTHPLGSKIGDKSSIAILLPALSTFLGISAFWIRAWMLETEGTPWISSILELIFWLCSALIIGKFFAIFSLGKGLAHSITLNLIAGATSFLIVFFFPLPGTVTLWNHGNFGIGLSPISSLETGYATHRILLPLIVSGIFAVFIYLYRFTKYRKLLIAAVTSASLAASLSYGFSSEDNSTFTLDKTPPVHCSSSEKYALCTHKAWKPQFGEITSHIDVAYKAAEVLSLNSLPKLLLLDTSLHDSQPQAYTDIPFIPVLMSENDVTQPAQWFASRVSGQYACTKKTPDEMDKILVSAQITRSLLFFESEGEPVKVTGTNGKFIEVNPSIQIYQPSKSSLYRFLQTHREEIQNCSFEPASFVKKINEPNG